MTTDEAQALLDVLAEVDFVGVQEFARLDDEGTRAIESARVKLRAIVNGSHQ